MTWDYYYCYILVIQAVPKDPSLRSFFIRELPSERTNSLPPPGVLRDDVDDDDDDDDDDDVCV